MTSNRVRNTPLVLIIRDGWGRNPHPEHDAFNAVKLAHTPVDDDLMANWPNTLIITCGEDVGLPAGTMGNSEVGHQNIGAGRVVDQEIMRITRAIRSGEFFRNPAFLGACEHIKATGGKLHIMGLVSDGLVHSDIQHLFALIDLAAQQKLPADRVCIHAFTDGRDVGPFTGRGFIQQLQDKLNATLASSHNACGGHIASVCGRYYAMDRDNRWERVAQAYAMLTGRAVSHPALNGATPRTAPTALDAVHRYYDQPTESSRAGDEFIVPTQMIDPQTSKPVGTIGDGDAVIFFNFRGDRPRELTKAFMLDDSAWAKVPNALPGGRGGFDRGQPLHNLYFCTMTGYEAGLPVTAIAFEKPPKMHGILGEVVSRLGLTQFRCAETEKFPHVTFFFNDYREAPFPGESRLLVPSPKDVSTYDQKPEMSAYGVCEAVLERLAAEGCEPLIVVNFANGDMVGHTGNLQAATKAIEVVDECVGRIVEATMLGRVEKFGRNAAGSLIITADHGNAEQMWDPESNFPHTAHTVYDVPLIIVGEQFRGWTLRSGGRLADIAPTALDMMGLDQPPEMTGQSLLESAPSRQAEPAHARGA